MTLIQFGKTYINFDLVTVIRDLSTDPGQAGPTPGLIRVEFGDGHCVDVCGDLQSLQDWLQANSTSATVS